MPIRLLPQEVSAKIAAGEVVERPASVVKELVENSLDAGATEVSIDVTGGGVEYIRVTDDGAGIPTDEVELAVHRFATSKVAGAQDLEAISTLGFRGEALHSIAAVSSVSLVTKSRAEEAGVRLDVEDGELTGQGPEGAAPGTSVTVRHLFRNFPVRRKFLRSTATETSRIQNLVTRYALAYPEVRFRLDIAGSTAFTSSGSGELREVVSSVYRLDTAQAMLELSPEPETDDHPELSISGIVSPPSVDRANRSYMSFFVNRRWVQNRMLGYALEQAYHGFQKERRYPLAVVNISLPHDEVDVNVHPAKTEVRFQQENRIFGAVQRAVRQTLTSHSPVPLMRHSGTTEMGPSHPPRERAFWPTAPFAPSETLPSAHGPPSSGPTDSRPAYAEAPVLKKALPALRVLGQVRNTYIAAEGPEGMYLIDQHAAHERVVFERVMAEALSRTPQTQSLLEPVTVEMNAQQQELLQSQQGLVSNLGFHVEPFGDAAYLLRGVPPLLKDGDPSRALVDVLDLMAEGGGFESWEERGAYSVACHGAIRAGKTLSQQEMSELTRQLEECQQPNTCPHGRPTTIHLSASQLEREFGRR